jgi:hypothetical protein
MKLLSALAVVLLAAVLPGGPAAAATVPAADRAGRPARQWRTAANHHHKMKKMDDDAIPKNLDRSTVKLSHAKRYRVALAPQKQPVVINVMHSWVLTLRTPNGKPVTGAVVTVDGGMPAHGHGLPTAPRVTRYLGDGKYLVEGMKFSMTGWWELRFAIARPQPDTVTFNVVVK